MRKISQIWFNIQGFLFPFIEKEIEEPLTEKLKQLVATLELIRVEDFVHIPEYWLGQSPKNRKQIARSFVAKAVYNMTTTRGLIDRLKTTPALRRICGWEKASQIPHESSFSRAFAEFAQNGIAQAEGQRADLINFERPEDIRYNERSNVERVNGRLKDEFGGKMVRVRGGAKVMAHLMFGILALTADQLLRFVT